jgi:hypothetical protein
MREPNVTFNRHSSSRRPSLSLASPPPATRLRSSSLLILLRMEKARHCPSGSITSGSGRTVRALRWISHSCCPGQSSARPLSHHHGIASNSHECVVRGRSAGGWSGRRCEVYDIAVHRGGLVMQHCHYSRLARLPFPLPSSVKCHIWSVACKGWRTEGAES